MALVPLIYPITVETGYFDGILIHIGGHDPTADAPLLSLIAFAETVHELYPQPFSYHPNCLFLAFLGDKHYMILAIPFRVM
jgi:hypothetical protein